MLFTFANSLLIGPYVQNVCLFFKGQIKQNVLEYNPEIGKNILDVNFEDLEYGNTYLACLQTLVFNYTKQNIKCRKDNPNQNCREVETTCEELPKTKRIPSQIIWSKEEDSFNPFTDIKIKMDEGTFDGKKSGLSAFIIE